MDEIEKAGLMGFAVILALILASFVTLWSYEEEIETSCLSKNEIVIDGIKYDCKIQDSQ